LPSAGAEFLQNGFFMNWFGAQEGDGFEYHLLALGLAFVVLVHGAGKASFDDLTTRNLETGPAI